LGGKHAYKGRLGKGRRPAIVVIYIERHIETST
jgi:hypothetical protein